MRQKGITPFNKNVEYSGNVMSNWFSMQFHGHLIFELLAVAIMVLFLIFFIRNFKHWKAFYSYENVAVSFFIVYVLFIVISSTLSFTFCFMSSSLICFSAFRPKSQAGFLQKYQRVWYQINLYLHHLSCLYLCLFSTRFLTTQTHFCLFLWYRLFQLSVSCVIYLITKIFISGLLP